MSPIPQHSHMTPSDTFMKISLGRFIFVTIPRQPVTQSPIRSSLDLETSGGSATTSSLELATLGLDVWFLVLVRTETEMLDCLSGVLWSTEEKSVASSWGTLSQLIQSQSLTTSCKDASTGGSGEAESSNAELWDGQETVVIGDGTDNDNSLVV